MNTTLNAEIRFGAATRPVRVPVGIASAVSDSKDISFRQVHNCGTPVVAEKKVAKKAATAVKTAKTEVAAVMQMKFCPSCGVEVEDTVSAFEYVKDKFVIFTDEEIALAKQDRSPVIRVEKFVPSNTVTALMVEKNHFLVPNAHVQGGYGTLYQALAKAKMAGFGNHSLWGKERPCTVYADQSFDGGVLILQSLHLHEDMVSPDFQSPIPTKEAEKIAKAIVAAGTGTLEETDLASAQRARLNEMVRAKLEGLDLPEAEAPEDEPEDTVDLMEALTQSLAAMQPA